MSLLHHSLSLSLCLSLYFSVYISLYLFYNDPIGKRKEKPLIKQCLNFTIKKVISHNPKREDEIREA